MKSSPRVAIVHDWLCSYAGAEKLLAELLGLYPQADLFSVIDFLPESKRAHLLHKKSKTTFIQHLPFAKKKYPLYLSLMPFAIEQWDFSSYDLILSSSHAVAKGVITSPTQFHLCYCHSPMRYAWDLQREYSNSWPVRFGLHKMRLWDVLSANRVDTFVANSKFVAKRIEKYYRRKASVIYSPTDLEFFSFHEKKEDFYLAASRLVSYKKIDLIVEAFSRLPEKKLIVVGEGPEMKKLQKMAPKNVSLLGYREDAVLRDLMQRAKGFIFAGIEDFGRVAVEAQACGTPVIAFGQGGLLESVRGLDHPNPTGVFFEEQTVESLIEALEEFEKREISYEECRKNAERFSPSRFRLEMSRFIEEEVKKFKRDDCDESTHISRGKRNKAVANVKELLSQTISQDRRKGVFPATNRQEDVDHSLPFGNFHHHK